MVTMPIDLEAVRRRAAGLLPARPEPVQHDVAHVVFSGEADAYQPICLLSSKEHAEDAAAALNEVDRLSGRIADYSVGELPVLPAGVIPTRKPVYEIDVAPQHVTGALPSPTVQTRLLWNWETFESVTVRTQTLGRAAVTFRSTNYAEVRTAANRYLEEQRAELEEEIP